jgi:hypothetical protein
VEGCEDVAAAHAVGTGNGITRWSIAGVEG